MLNLVKGRYVARLAASAPDLIRAQHLRHLAFRGHAGRDADRFDDQCHHGLVEDVASGALVCCFRLLLLRDGRDIGQSYSAQHYDLSALGGFSGPMVEMGRFCLHPDWRDPDILRVAWAAMTRYVDAQAVEMLFGCSSFQGTEVDRYTDAFALLSARHLAPKRWRPRVKAPKVVRFAESPRLHRPDPERALHCMPPLLRTYLGMGGWVSDHAVVDAEMNTLHVFTGLEISAIPPARARLLRAAAG